VLAGFARQLNSLSLSKAGYRIGLTSLLLVAGAGAVQDATALNETRTLSFHHTHSDENLTVTFKRDGRYDEEALKQLNHFLRDWRSQEHILWEVYRDVDGRKPIQIISSYRSPATNAMLRRRSTGVARFSQHMLGHAMDFYIPDVPLEQIRYAGLLSDFGIAVRSSRHRQHPPLAAHEPRPACQGIPGRSHGACAYRRQAAEGI